MSHGKPRGAYLYEGLQLIHNQFVIVLMADADYHSDVRFICSLMLNYVLGVGVKTFD